MRKYHQLLLIVISCASVIVLLFYKSENTRLKDVLSAVNFFGRKDAAELHRMENFTETHGVNMDFNRPLPMWQLIGDSFHAYASYWHRNELIFSGGEILTLVTGKSGAVVNFRCTAYYNEGNLAQGKFRFQHINQSAANGVQFNNYIFYCRLKTDFGEPNSILYTDLSGSSNVEHKLRLRHIKLAKRDNAPRTQLTVCLDLVSFNMSSSFAKSNSNLLQFFLHHHVLGVNYFIAYNGDEIPTTLMQKLRIHKGIHLQILPFNFPFTNKNNTGYLRDFIRTDCLLRNMHLTRYTILLAPNEFLLPNAKLSNDQSMLYSLHHYAGDITAFEVSMYSICINENIKLLTNNSFYDPEVANPHRLYIYKPRVPVSTTPIDTGAVSGSVTLSLSMALAHNFIKCVHVGKDGLQPWESMLRQDFMNNVNEIRAEVKELMYK